MRKWRPFFVSAVLGTLFLGLGILSLLFAFGTKFLTQTAEALLFIAAIFLLFAWLFFPGRSLPNEIRLIVSHLSNARRFGLEWPTDKPGVWAGVYDPHIAESLDTRFLIQNTSPSHRIYFAAAAWARHNAHDELKLMLANEGSPFTEEDEERQKEQWTTILGSTQSEKIVSLIFEHYSFYYGSFIRFPFIVAQHPQED
jgi:hypothetical protein